LVFGLGALELLVIGSLLALAFVANGQPLVAAAAVGFALAFSSTALVLPISGTRTPVGRAALSMLLFEDIMIVPIIFILGALAPYADAAGFGGLVTTLWQGALVVLVMMVAGRFFLPRLFASAARAKSSELFMAASLLVVLASALATQLVGLSPIVGALIAGLLIAETEYHSEVEAIIDPFKGLALGIFLITVGMGIDMAMLWRNLWAIGGAVVGVLVLKALVTGVLLRLMGARTGTATETGILMASPSETSLIVLAAAAQASIVSAATAQFWQVVIAIGLTITPLLARLGRMAGRRVEPAPSLDDADIKDATPRVIVIGLGRVGRLVAEMLDRHGKPYIGIDSDSDIIESARADGFKALYGNAARGDVLDKLGMAECPAVILTMDEHVLAQQLVKKLRAAHPDLPIIARARDTDHATELYKSGATVAVPETLESSLQLSEAALVELGVAMGPVIASIHEKRDQFREQIQHDAELDEKPKLKTS
jgi:CPA2 family monovalent cation:H+ antiporter-2